MNELHMGPFNQKPFTLHPRQKQPQHQKDTEALIRDLQVPQVDPEVVGRQIRLLVAVHRYGVDVVSVGVGEDAAGGGLHHQLHGSHRGHTQRAHHVPRVPTFVLQVVAVDALVALRHLPQLDCFVWNWNERITSTVLSQYFN